ncbi:hypothetical protein BDP55DRAFT_634533 [Colletotrichum godetiae]|uniref:Uncharacterized protein n=1 Tax=Colletotrichum godetiae TaxID=1209918 RepID=A0AAJ0EV16_9PEZI|nr:uncharacterized protein BDP55DRAFT_634533 [Colletotrichum godetiae]KAK1672774.1 hypothetical protein BDP55DRAFT_634533 [Colletotrichum godetiae]
MGVLLATCLYLHRQFSYSFSRLALAWSFDPLGTGTSAFRSCTRNRPKSDDECVSATIVSTSLEADIAAARTVQKAGEFDSHHATTLEDEKRELSATAPPWSWCIEEECPCIVSHPDRKRKDPVPISSRLERLANVMRSWIMGIRAYFPLGLPITHADLAPWYAMPKEAPARCGDDENEGAQLVHTVLKRIAKEHQAR